MIVLNTTFHVHAWQVRAFVDWLKREYIPEAEMTGELSNARIVRVLGGHEDDRDGISLALSMECPTLATAKRWHDGEPGCRMRGRMSELFGKDAVFFTSYLQVID